jgi:hypothetical protein
MQGFKKAINDADSGIWYRKLKNLQALVADANTIEQQILELQEQKMPIYDEIAQLRSTMVDECCHPLEFLLEQDNWEENGITYKLVKCKFCERTLSIKPNA